MERAAPNRMIASCFALCGFAVALLAGMDASVTTASALLRAIVALAVCYMIGTVIGAAGEACIAESFSDYSRRNPAPDPLIPAGNDGDIIDVEPVADVATAKGP